MRIVCPGVAVTGQPHQSARGGTRDDFPGPTPPLFPWANSSLFSSTDFSVSRKRALGMAFAYSHSLGPMGERKLVFETVLST